jgi:hypothetical protein
MDGRIGRSAHRHSLLGQTFSVSRQFGYPCRIVDTGLRGPESPQCFSTWSSPRDASLPSLGSQRAWFPPFTGTMKALRLPICESAVAYFVRFRCPHDPPNLFSPLALLKRRRSPPGPGFGCRMPPAVSQVDPSCALLRSSTRSNRCALAMTVTSMLPPQPIRRRLRRWLIWGLTHAASAPAHLRFVLPLTRKARFQLAG